MSTKINDMYNRVRKKKLIHSRDYEESSREKNLTREIKDLNERQSLLTKKRTKVKNESTQMEYFIEILGCTLKNNALILEKLK